MSGYGTKKRGGDEAVQLTFPSVFEAFEFMSGIPKHSYFPSQPSSMEHLQSGDDHYSRFHEIKRHDAHRKVLNRLQANASAERMMLSSHQNYYGMPKAVLSQRVFANPALGAGGMGGDLYSARRDTGLAPFECVDREMRGGVLFTREGRQYAKKVLADRVTQLDNISSLARGETTETPEGAEPRGDFGDASKVEFNLLRQNVIDAVETNKVDKLALNEVGKMLVMLFRYAVSADSSDLGDIIEGFENIVENVQALIDSNTEMGMDDSIPPLRTTLSLIRRALNYSEEMFVGVNRPENERKALSKSLIRKYKFANVIRKASPVTPSVPPVSIPAPAMPPAEEQNEAEFDEAMFDEAMLEEELGVSADEITIGLPDGRIVRNTFGLPKKGSRNIYSIIDEIPDETKRSIIKSLYPSARTNTMGSETLRRNIKKIIDGKKV